MLSQPSIAILTVAGPGIGMGHYSRCLSLAYAFMEQSCQITLTIDGPEDLVQATSNFTIRQFKWQHDPEYISHLLLENNLVVVDSYQIGNSVREVLESCDPWRIVSFDDMGIATLRQGTIINPAPGSLELYMPVNHPDRRILSGIAFQALRPPFWEPKTIILRENIRTILIFLGADDACSLAPRLYKTLTSKFDCRIIHIAASFSRTNQELRTILKSSDHLETDITAEQLIELCHEADLAICAAGQTCLEFLCLELPVILIQTADNQAGNVHFWLQKWPYSTPLNGRSYELDKMVIESIKKLWDIGARQQWQKNCHGLIDGQGARRIAKHVIKWMNDAH